MSQIALTTSEVCTALGISRQRVHQLVQAGGLRRYQGSGRRMVYLAADVQRHAAKRDAKHKGTKQ